MKNLFCLYCLHNKFFVSLIDCFSEMYKFAFICMKPLKCFACGLFGVVFHTVNCSQFSFRQFMLYYENVTADKRIKSSSSVIQKLFNKTQHSNFFSLDFHGVQGLFSLRNKIWLKSCTSKRNKIEFIIVYNSNRMFSFGRKKICYSLFSIKLLLLLYCLIFITSLFSTSFRNFVFTKLYLLNFLT